MVTPILNALKNLPNQKRIPFHMPGHKRNYKDIFREIGKYDITEIRGYDNLHCPQTIIRESMDYLREVFSTYKSWYLINGSTSGIQAAIASVCRPGDSIVIARNCHKAVYHMISLLHLKAYYLSADFMEKYGITMGMGEESFDELEEYIKNHPIKAVVLTSPTYEGVISDIEGFHHILNKYKIPLIVDEAHGAHFKFHNFFPDSAIDKGADLVIQSTHKTLPSFTQTALLHLCSDLISAERIEKYLDIFETSSPSYLLLASAEYGVSYMDHYVDHVQQYVDNLDNFIKKCGQLKNISLLDRKKISCYDYDRSKLVFLLHKKNTTGRKFSSLLFQKYHIELEMDSLFYSLGMTSVMDGAQEFNVLWKALSETDQIFSEEDMTDASYGKINIRTGILPEKIMESWECDLKEAVYVPVEEGIHRICAAGVALYPPGIPLLVPGEKINEEIVENIKYYLYNGYNVTGLKQQSILVIK